MTRILFTLVALLLMFACIPEDNSYNGGNQNNPDELTITGDALDVTDYSATLTGYANLPFELGDAEVGIMYDKLKSFEDAMKIVATGLDGNNKFSVTATGLSTSTTYYYKSYVQSGMACKYGAVKSFTTRVPTGAVDLGIVMTRDDGSTYKLFWAKSNLSEKGFCSNPEDYGDYFAWGETEPKDNYDWETYGFCTFSSNTYTKYNDVDNKSEFKDYGYEDDAARQALGGKWRVPTDAEWTELRTKCSWTWTTNYNRTGVSGIIVTASNSNSIFLPAAGCQPGFVVPDSYGVYWSSSLLTGDSHFARVVDFGSSNVYRDFVDRFTGASVRAVSE